MSDAEPSPNDSNEYDQLREQIAETIYNSAVREARSSVVQVNTRSDIIKTVIDMAKSESDRSAAILIFALVEDIMLDAFKSNLSGDVKGGWNEIIGGNGLLATANDRLTLLVMLKWIRQNTYHDLRMLKSIRNDFAHHANISNFDDNKIRSKILEMSRTDEELFDRMEGMSGFVRPNFTARNQYLARAALTLVGLASDLAILPHAIAHRVHPGSVSNYAWDELPDNLKSLKFLAADTVISLLEVRENKSGSSV